MRKKELEKAFEDLKERVNSLGTNFCELSNAFDFVNKYGKDAIHCENICDIYGRSVITIDYLYNGKVQSNSIPRESGFEYKLNVVENGERSAILEVCKISPYPHYECKKVYYQLFKDVNVCRLIPKPACVLEKELAEQEQSAKSTSSVKKESKKK